MLAFFSDGAETTIGMLVWPIFIFQILKGDYLKIGILSTFIIGFTVILQLILGKHLDKDTRKEKVLKFGSAFSSISWIVKIFIATAFQIFIVDAFHNLMKIFTRIPFDTLTYEAAADEGHYVDEFTILHEIACNAGKIFVIALIIVSSIFLPIQYVFVFAAVASICLNLLRPKTQKEIIA